MTAPPARYRTALSKLVAREEQRAATMRGVPNDIDHQEGVAEGLQMALDLFDERFGSAQ